MKQNKVQYISYETGQNKQIDFLTVNAVLNKCLENIWNSTTN